MSLSRTILDLLAITNPSMYNEISSRLTYVIQEAGGVTLNYKFIQDNIRDYNAPVSKGSIVSLIKDADLPVKDTPVWLVTGKDKEKSSREETFFTVEKTSIYGRDTDCEKEQRVVNADDVVAVFNPQVDHPHLGLYHVGAIKDKNSSQVNHSIIKGNDIHSLATISYPLGNKVNCVFIDTPYAGAKKWVFDGVEVDKNDDDYETLWLNHFNHRLYYINRLIDKNNCTIIVSADDSNKSSLEIAIKDKFPTARVTSIMVKVDDNRSAKEHNRNMYKTFIFAFFGNAKFNNFDYDPLWSSMVEPYEETSVPWFNLLKSNHNGRVRGSKFYPIYVDKDTSKIVHVGKAVPAGMDISSLKKMDNCKIVLPLAEDGKELCWVLTAKKLKELVAQGYAKAMTVSSNPQIAYLKDEDITKATF